MLIMCFPSLQAYDQHLNMILGDVEEIVTTVEIDDETYEEIVRVSDLSVIIFPSYCLSSVVNFKHQGTD